MKRTLLAAAAIALFSVAPASAQSPVGSTYGGQGQVVTEVVPTPEQGVAGATVDGATVPAAAVSAAGVGPGVAILGPAGSRGAALPSGTGQAANPGSGVAPDTASDNAPGSQRAAAAPAGERAVQKLRGDSLPFTGFDVLLMIVGGAVLVAIGLGMRRLARQPV